MGNGREGKRQRWDDDVHDDDDDEVEAMASRVKAALRYAPSGRAKQVALAGLAKSQKRSAPKAAPAAFLPPVPFDPPTPTAPKQLPSLSRGPPAANAVVSPPAVVSRPLADSAAAAPPAAAAAAAAAVDDPYAFPYEREQRREQAAGRKPRLFDAAFVPPKRKLNLDGGGGTRGAHAAAAAVMAAAVLPAAAAAVPAATTPGPPPPVAVADAAAPAPAPAASSVAAAAAPSAAAFDDGKQQEDWRRSGRGFLRREQDTKRSMTGTAVVRGLPNIGNSCYINAALQALLSLPPFIADIINHYDKFSTAGCRSSNSSSSSSRRPLADISANHAEVTASAAGGAASVASRLLSDSSLAEFARLVKAMIKARGADTGASEGGVYVRALKNAVSKAGGRFSGYVQEDAHEFICELLSRLQSDALDAAQPAIAPVPRPEDAEPQCRGGTEPPPDARTSRPGLARIRLGSTDCPTTKNFCSVVETTLECDSCHHSSSSQSAYSHFSLDLPDAASRRGFQKPPSLQHLLENFFKAEQLELTCDNCGRKKQSSTLTKTMRRLPRILVLHLKRFSMEAETRWQPPLQHPSMLSSPSPPLSPSAASPSSPIALDSSFPSDDRAAASCPKAAAAVEAAAVEAEAAAGASVPQRGERVTATVAAAAEGSERGYGCEGGDGGEQGPVEASHAADASEAAAVPEEGGKGRIGGEGRRGGGGNVQRSSPGYDATQLRLVKRMDAIRLLPKLDLGFCCTSTTKPPRCFSSSSSSPNAPRRPPSPQPVPTPPLASATPPLEATTPPLASATPPLASATPPLAGGATRPLSGSVPCSPSSAARAPPDAPSLEARGIENRSEKATAVRNPFAVGWRLRDARVRKEEEGKRGDEGREGGVEEEEAVGVMSEEEPVDTMEEAEEEAIENAEESDEDKEEEEEEKEEEGEEEGTEKVVERKDEQGKKARGKGRKKVIGVGEEEKGRKQWQLHEDRGQKHQIERRRTLLRQEQAEPRRQPRRGAAAAAAAAADAVEASSLAHPRFYGLRGGARESVFGNSLLGPLGEITNGAVGRKGGWKSEGSEEGGPVEDQQQKTFWKDENGWVVDEEDEGHGGAWQQAKKKQKRSRNEPLQEKMEENEGRRKEELGCGRARGEGGSVKEGEQGGAKRKGGFVPGGHWAGKGVIEWGEVADVLRAGDAADGNWERVVGGREGKEEEEEEREEDDDMRRALAESKREAEEEEKRRRKQSRADREEEELLRQAMEASLREHQESEKVQKKKKTKKESGGCWAEGRVGDVRHGGRDGEREKGKGEEWEFVRPVHTNPFKTISAWSGGWSPVPRPQKAEEVMDKVPKLKDGAVACTGDVDAGDNLARRKGSLVQILERTREEKHANRRAHEGHQENGQEKGRDNAKKGKVEDGYASAYEFSSTQEEQDLAAAIALSLKEAAKEANARPRWSKSTRSKSQNLDQDPVPLPSSLPVPSQQSDLPLSPRIHPHPSAASPPASPLHEASNVDVGVQSLPHIVDLGSPMLISTPDCETRKARELEELGSFDSPKATMAAEVEGAVETVPIAAAAEAKAAMPHIIEVVDEDDESEVSNCGDGECSSSKYVLCAVIRHLGSTLDCGHFIADVFHHSTRQWLRCDDEIVSNVQYSSMFNSEGDRSGYVFFYVHRDMPCDA